MRIELKNYKRFTDLRTQIADEPGGWTFIHGWPNSGKTTLLEAIALLIMPPTARAVLSNYTAPPIGNAEICAESHRIVFSDRGYTVLGTVPLIGFSTIYSPLRAYHHLHKWRFDLNAWNVTEYSPRSLSHLLDPEAWLQGLAIDHYRTGDQWWPALKGPLTRLACGSVDFDDKARLSANGRPLGRKGSSTQDMIGLFVDIIASWCQYTGADAKPDLSQIQGTVLIDRIDLHLNYHHLRDFILTFQREMPKLNFIVTMDGDNYRTMINWIRRQDVSIPL